MKQTISALLLAILITVGFAYFGGVKSLGGHHWWDTKTAVFGAPFGAVLAVLLAQYWDHKPARLGLSLAILVVGFAAAKYGQTQFAATYGDDALAGKLWFTG